MTDNQLLFLLHKKFEGCWFQSVMFSEMGDMEVKFFDSGGNFHHQVLHENGTLSTVDESALMLNVPE